MKSFINKIKTVNNALEEIYLVTMNVKSLYTEIPNLEAIATAKKALVKEPDKTVATEVIVTFLALILTLNNVVFNGNTF